MTLKKPTKKEYEALFNEALFILKKICQDSEYTDHMDIAHASLEIYFMKLKKNIVMSLEAAVQEAMQGRSVNSIAYKNMTSSPDESTMTPYEAQRDLDSIYSRAHVMLSFQEKYVFCKLLSDCSLEIIAFELKLPLDNLEDIKKSLIGKLHHAATSATKSRKKSRTRPYFVGSLRKWDTKVN